MATCREIVGLLARWDAHGWRRMQEGRGRVPLPGGHDGEQSCMRLGPFRGWACRLGHGGGGGSGKR